MEIIIRKSFKLKETFLEASIELAKQFLESQYPDKRCFKPYEEIRYIFGKGTRARYFRNSKTFDPPTVYINYTYMLYLYTKKTLKLDAGENGVYAGREVCVQCSLVHELTHHLQYEFGWNKGELETTKNEIEFLRQYHPDIHKKLKPIK